MTESIQLPLTNPADEQYRQRLEIVRPHYLDPDKIVLDDTNGFQIINASEIIYLEANGNYTDLFLTGNRKLTFCRILKEFVTLLEDQKFIKRTHRSYMVNINHIISCRYEGIIQLHEQHSASLGDSYKDDFLSCFKRI